MKSDYTTRITNLSIIFPVYNEAGSIEKVIQEWIFKLNKLGVNYQIILCEDGSTDGTSQIVKNLKDIYGLTLNQKANRRGYGKALIDGIKAAKFDNILCADSDGQCDPNDLRKFLEAFGTAEVLIGQRVRRADAISRIIYSTVFGMLFYKLFPIEIHDPSAPFTLFSRKRFLKLSHYLLYLEEGFWWGFVATCVKKNVSIKEIQINHRKRFDGDTQVYKPSKIFKVALRNVIGLFRLKFSNE